MYKPLTPGTVGVSNEVITLNALVGCKTASPPLVCYKYRHRPPSCLSLTCYIQQSTVHSLRASLQRTYRTECYQLVQNGCVNQSLLRRPEAENRAAPINDQTSPEVCPLQLICAYASRLQMGKKSSSSDQEKKKKKEEAITRVDAVLELLRKQAPLTAKQVRHLGRLLPRFLNFLDQACWLTV